MQDEVFTFQDKENKLQFRKTFSQSRDFISQVEESKMQDEVFTFQDKENKLQFRKTFSHAGHFISLLLRICLKACSRWGYIMP
jgi:hypothetical protein